MDDCKEFNISSLTTTFGSLDDARRVARAAVIERLAACAQVEPIESFYVWQDAPCEESEWRVTFKTTPDREAALAEWLAREHPYELPQLLAARWRGSAAYAAWVRARTA